jgi:hypothetical protein
MTANGGKWPKSRPLQNVDIHVNVRKHVLSDLQPYVCTYLDCSLHEHLFQNQEEWWQHESQCHRFQWFCNAGKHEIFQEASEFVNHMKDHHHQVIRDNQLPDLKHMFRHPTLSQEGVCNLCGTWSTKLRSHIAKHLQQLALFAIPLTDYMNDSDTEDAQSDKAHRSRGALEDDSLPSTEVTSLAEPHDNNAREATPHAPAVSSTNVTLFVDELSSSLPGQGNENRILDPPSDYEPMKRRTLQATFETGIVDHLTEGHSTAAERPPSTFVTSNEDQDTY